MNSYQRLLHVVNTGKVRAERTTCECGKEIYTRQLEKHKTTALHHTLFFKKQQAMPGQINNE